MKRNLHDKRENYTKSVFEYTNLFETPIQLFDKLYKLAEEDPHLDEPNAMTLSTVAEGQPQARVVLLKEYSEEGFVFFSHYNSRKGEAIAENPKVCLSFFWPSLEQQIIVEGVAEKISPERSDEYFYSRPLQSQIGALVSQQSRRLESRASLEKSYKERENSSEAIKRPETWGGYVVRAQRFEFWQGRPGRLHDRLEFIWNESKIQWDQSLLYP